MFFFICLRCRLWSLNHLMINLTNIIIRLIKFDTCCEVEFAGEGELEIHQQQFY